MDTMAPSESMLRNLKFNSQFSETHEDTFCLYFQQLKLLFSDLPFTNDLQTSYSLTLSRAQPINIISFVLPFYHKHSSNCINKNIQQRSFQFEFICFIFFQSLFPPISITKHIVRESLIIKFVIVTQLTLTLNFCKCFWNCIRDSIQIARCTNLNCV